MKLTATALRLSLLAALTAVLMIGEGVGQEIRGYGQSGDSFSAVFVNQDGTFAITGKKDHGNVDRMWLMVLTPDGGVVIDQEIEGVQQSSFGRDIIEVDGGGWLIGGVTNYGNSLSSFSAVRTDGRGDLVWANSYDPEDNFYHWNRVNDVIELKNSDFILAGSVCHLPDEEIQYVVEKGWMVRVNAEGDQIWNSGFHGNIDDDHDNRSYIWSILQSGDQIIGCGKLYGSGAWLFSVSADDGELLWERALDYDPDLQEGSHLDKGKFHKIVSHNDEYYSFGDLYGYGPGDRQPKSLMTKFTANGEIVFQRDLPLRFTTDFIDGESYSTMSAKVSPLGGFILLNQGRSDRKPLSGVARLDEFGNALWEDTLRSAFLYGICCTPNSDISMVGSLTRERPPSNAILYRLSDHSPPFFRRGGHDGEEDYDRENPEDREQVGNGFEIRVLQGDVIRFWVDAHDRQDDQITYEWTLEGEVVSDSTAAIIAFDELGRFDVVCRISDDTTTIDSLWWRVNVVEFYIRSHQPSETVLSPARGEAVDFSLEVRAVEGQVGNLSYRWTLDSAVFSNEEAFTLDPLENFEPKRVAGVVSNGNAADSVVWTAQLRSLFRSWLPEGNEISAPVGSTVRFAIAFEDGLPEGSLPFWIEAGDTLAWDTLTWEVTFGEVGRTWVELAVMIDQVMLENVVWSVNVTPLGIFDDGSVGQAGTPVLLDVSPNPFNSQLTIKYMTGSAARPTRLSIHDISGREVARLVDAQAVSPLWLTAGDSGVNRRGLTPYEAVSWNASALPAGIYFARLESGGEIRTVKMVLVR